ncbi:MAG: hypothetical protein HQM10_25365 [Candidatus Riflebacteria bacterium]|nr:hypothetical protein [Candidatus Riflebacteria bacterium]
MNSNNRLNRLSGVFLIIFVLLTFIPADALKLPKIDLGKNKTLENLLKGAGIVILIRQIGGQLNDFINTLLVNRGAAISDATKVVPILTLGQGVEAGACQISGPPEEVNKVQVVLALAATFDKGRRLNMQALIPSASLNPAKLDRVQKVGISAIIDYHL